MKQKQIYAIAIAVLVAIALGWWGFAPAPSPIAQPASQSELALLVAEREPIQPIPLQVELDAEKVALGEKLFYDTQLSSDNSISCATCHDLKAGGTDRRPTSEGMNGILIATNSPTVFNSGFLHRLNWDGKASSLEEQIDGPIASANEMGGLGWGGIISRLRQSPEYVAAFRAVYDEKITAEAIRDAIATFERSLYTPNAPFDRYLRGNTDAITAEEKQGYELFKAYGCAACHQGMLVGGNMFQTLGIFGDYFRDRGGELTKADLGRYNVTQNERDRFVFKVPSLRNVVLTAPYFHDGNIETLDAAIKVMAKYQLGVEMPQEDVDAIMLFLRSLTGEFRGEPL